MHAGLRRIESIAPRRAAEFGGKAKNLASLVRGGFPVPLAFALSSRVASDAFERILSPRDRPRSLLRAAVRELEDARLTAIAEEIRRAPLPEELVSSLAEVRAELATPEAPWLAVRSSSTREDESLTSAAGLHETVLGVATDEAIADAIRTCWASVFTRRTLSYLRSLGVDDDVGVGVVIQRMVAADVSGVLFTMNPLTGDRNEMIANASFGLGTVVVDGQTSPDTFRIEKSSGWVRDRVLGAKEARVRLGASGIEREAATDSSQRASLDDGQLRELAAVGRRIEQHFESPRDIEFAFSAGRLFVLQARPVTAVPEVEPPRPRRTGPVDRGRIVWSNVNVGEALPGVVTPFTWSVLSGFSDTGFRRAFSALGCTVPRDAELVGNFRGRIYLNLSEFLDIASQVPGLSAESILALGGGDPSITMPEPGGRPGMSAFIARLPWTVGRLVREHRDLHGRVARFEARFHEEMERLARFDLRLLSGAGVERVLSEVERALDATGQVLLTVYGNLLASVIVLRTLLRVVDPVRKDALLRDLLTGLVGVDSAAPGIELARIAELAREDATAHELLARLDSADTVDLASLPEGATKRALTAFLDRHGQRGVREAEIAEPRWAEDPSLLLRTLALHVRRGSTTPWSDVEARQKLVREGAEVDVRKRVPFPLRGAFDLLLEHVHRIIRTRERLRTSVVGVLGAFRRVALDASRRIGALEPEAGTGAAFFLTAAELHLFLRGEVPSVSRIVVVRRIQYQRDLALPPPPRSFTGLPERELGDGAPKDELRGLAASRGRARAKARVLRSPSELEHFQPGEVLVTEHTDIGWTPVFLVAGAVVTELGGPLSHAAIVAREYGVPAVVNVGSALGEIATGDELEVDGDLGVVRVLTRAADRESGRATR